MVAAVGAPEGFADMVRGVVDSSRVGAGSSGGFEGVGLTGVYSKLFLAGDVLWDTYGNCRTDRMDGVCVSAAALGAQRIADECAAGRHVVAVASAGDQLSGSVDAARRLRVAVFHGICDGDDSNASANLLGCMNARNVLHFSSTGSLVVLGAPGVTGRQEAIWYGIYGVALWGVAVVAGRWKREIGK